MKEVELPRKNLNNSVIKEYEEAVEKGLKQDKIKYLICEECGATAKKVKWKEYREIKKKHGLIEEDRSKQDKIEGKHKKNCPDKDKPIADMCYCDKCKRINYGKRKIVVVGKIKPMLNKKIEEGEYYPIGLIKLWKEFEKDTEKVRTHKLEFTGTSVFKAQFSDFINWLENRN